MSKLSHSFLHDRIGAVERRLERRRTRLLDAAAEATVAASRSATKVIPVAAAVGAGLVALYFTRKLTQKPPSFAAYRARYEEPRRGLRWAQIAGIVGSAVRIGSSPQVRAFWHGFRRAKERQQQRAY